MKILLSIILLVSALASQSTNGTIQRLYSGCGSMTNTVCVNGVPNIGNVITWDYALPEIIGVVAVMNLSPIDPAWGLPGGCQVRALSTISINITPTGAPTQPLSLIIPNHTAFVGVVFYSQIAIFHTSLGVQTSPAHKITIGY